MKRSLLAPALLSIFMAWGITSTALLLHAAPPPASPSVDLSHAVIVARPHPDALEQKAITILQEEIAKRTGLSLPVSDTWPAGNTPVIALGLFSEAEPFAGSSTATLQQEKPPGTEGFSLSVINGPRPTVLIAGQDHRGLIYGVGYLLRKISWADHSTTVPQGLHYVGAPHLALRGHQLGYRPKVNAYDAWSEAQFDQYIRELALFGVNSIEILPPRTDDEPTSPHMKVPQLEMMEKLSRIIDSYGLDVWIWYPNMGKDYTHEAGIEKEMAERDLVFRRLPRIDHILVPGGDPGNLAPDVFFPWMDKMAEVLHRSHPKAKIWVSPQAFDPTQEWLDAFYRHVNAKPSWLGGVTFGPWIATPLPEMRRIVDPSIPIRNYPDITHNLDCQYPVPNWDLAFAQTLHRECYNPRPVAMKAIHNLFATYTCGSLCYSEGINDDVNKFVWSAQDWDTHTPVLETVQDYCRLFISPEHGDEIAAGFFAEEKNWVGPLATNRQVDETLQQWQALEKKASPVMKESYRFQMGLLRAYYDAYVKQRLIHETALESQALAVLRRASTMGSFAAMTEATAILRKALLEPVAQDYKVRCEALADSLFAKIGSQTSVKRHGAENRTRGAFMDGIDEPLNNVGWLTAQFRHVRTLSEEADRLAAVDEMLNRTNPGPGGFYDSLGDPASEHRIVNKIPWAEDPGTLKSPRVTFYYEIGRADDSEVPLAWKKQADTLYNTPLRLSYDHLDPNATYSVRATYSGRTARRMILHANDKYLISDHIQSRKPVIQEFPIPHEATASGHLELEWNSGEGERSCEVAEVWLIRH